MEGRNRLPSLAWLRAFDAAGRRGSFKAAAEELHVTASSISHQIRDLEEFLGASLFVRLPRAVELTPLGERYLCAVRTAFDSLVAATDEVRGPGKGEPFRIGMLPFMASEVFVPALPFLTEALPGVEFQIESRIRLRDLRDDDGGRLDAVLRYGRGHFEGLSGLLIARVSLVPICAPAWLEAHPVKEPGDLAGQRLVVLKSGFQGWQEWGRAHSIELPGVAELLSFDNYASAMRAVEQSLGVGLGLRPIVDRWLEAGRVVIALDRPVEVSEALYLVFAPGGERQPQLETLGARLRELFGRASSA